MAQCRVCNHKLVTKIDLACAEVFNNLCADCVEDQPWNKSAVNRLLNSAGWPGGWTHEDYRRYRRMTDDETFGAVFPECLSNDDEYVQLALAILSTPYAHKRIVAMRRLITYWEDNMPRWKFTMTMLNKGGSK
jgi:hypothetical protein